MSVLIFLAVLFLLVLVHEWGHFIVAKLTGMRVDEFGIGFPPRLFGIKRGETEYTFNAFPIGGFVKIFGEDGTNEPSSPVSNEVRDRRSEALAEAGEGGEDGDGAPLGQGNDRSFSSKSKWAQAAVLVAGVSMNVIFAWFLFTLAFSIGVQTAVSEEEASESAKLVITEMLADGPAARAQLAPGAVITSVATQGESLERLTPSTFSEFIGAHSNEDVVIAYRLGNEMRITTLKPETGVLEGEPERAAVGVALSLVDVVVRPLHIAAYDALIHTAVSLKEITLGLGKLFGDIFRLQADLSQVAGPVGIVGLVGDASAFGMTALIMFTAFISLNLAIINLLPFPALDGGRIVFVLIEAVKGSPITPRYALALNTVGFALLILLMVIVTWNDIAKLI